MFGYCKRRVETAADAELLGCIRVCSRPPAEPVDDGVILGLVARPAGSVGMASWCNGISPSLPLDPLHCQGRWTRIGCLQGCGTTRCQCINSTLALRLWNAARLSGPCKRVVLSLTAPGCHRDAAPFLCRCAVAPLSSANARKSSTKIRDHCGDVGEEQTGDSAPTGNLQAC